MAKKVEQQQSIEDILNQVKFLSEQAGLSSNHQLDLFKNDDLDKEEVDMTIDFSSISDTQDPDKSHRLYYGIRRLLLDNLPKGKENKKLREFIYYEKNLFLNRGLETGADSRMSYISNFLEVAFGKVTNWILTGTNPFDIYMDFYNLNEEKGFHKGKIELSEFNKKLFLAVNTKIDKNK